MFHTNVALLDVFIRAIRFGVDVKQSPKDLMFLLRKNRDRLPTLTSNSNPVGS